MPKHRYTLLYHIGATVVLLLLLTACDQRTVYNHYEHTPVAGWEKNDTLTFVTEPMAQAGTYQEEVGLRITADYPFTQLVLVVEQTVHQPSANSHHRDTLTCNVIDQRGNALGTGVSQYQYTFPLTTISLDEGDRLSVTIRHDMKREILPGITDVGLKVSHVSGSGSRQYAGR